MYRRAQIQILRNRLAEPPRFILAVVGPRQIGKTFMVRQALAGHPASFAAADQALPDVMTAGNPSAVISFKPGAPPTSEWLVEQWTRARAHAGALPPDTHYVLALDEIQKIPRWSETVKGLWDADRASGLNLHVVLLGSSPWLMQKGLTESLAGRYELIGMNHWSYPEMQEAFDLSLDEYLYFGGYPGAAILIRDEARWRNYIRGSLIQPNIEKDILQMTRVDKPALLKALFELGCQYSGQIISYTKLLGQLQDAGNTVTLAHYLDLLSQAGLLTGLQKYAGQRQRQRGSSPKLNALNTALISALSGYTYAEARADRSYWGRLTESAVGAHLGNHAGDQYQLHYWRESPHEVDFVLARGRRLLAVEVKSASAQGATQGLAAFVQQFSHAKRLVVGDGGVPLSLFLARDPCEWIDNA